MKRFLMIMFFIFNFSILSAMPFTEFMALNDEQKDVVDYTKIEILTYFEVYNAFKLQLMSERDFLYSALSDYARGRIFNIRFQVEKVLANDSFILSIDLTTGKLLYYAELSPNWKGRRDLKVKDYVIMVGTISGVYRYLKNDVAHLKVLALK